MKNIFSILALSLVSTSLLATPVPKEKLDDYKQAVLIAASSRSFTCEHLDDLNAKNKTDVDQMLGYVDIAISANISNDGTQPLLVFIAYFPSSKAKVAVSVTTTADYKSIISMKRERLNYKQEKSNSGDLKNPSIIVRDTWVPSAHSTICY